MTTVETRPRLLASGGPSLAEHRHRHGPLPRPDAAELVDLLREAGLTGRGGAGFPTWRKLADVLVAGGRPVLVANGAEGEPASSKDLVLLQHAPHLVLDGLEVVAAALGADTRHAHVAAGAVTAVRAALAERGGPPVTVTEAPESFLAGEESAVLRHLAGGPALPTDRTTRVTRSGLGGRPTLVQNVETLAHVALLARHGAGWFRTAGTATDPGTRLVTLSGDVARPGVLEVGSGAGLEPLCGSGSRAVLVGGYHGAWVPDGALPTTRLSSESLRPWGASPGAGVLHVLGPGRCGLVVAAEIVTWLGGQSARQCGPCRHGLPTLAGVLSRLARGERTPGLVEEVQRLAWLVDGRGSCRHPDGTVRLVRSTLAVFADDVALHLRGRCEVHP